MRPPEERPAHTFDGIYELNNPLPWWLRTIFLCAFLFSCWYMLHYHWGGKGLSIAEEYAIGLQEMERRRESMAAQVSEERLAAIMADSTQVVAGKEVFTSHCVACHTATGGGAVGPNLTDAFWIHGDGSLMAIHRVVSEGVPLKGMLAWQSLLKPSALNSVVAYVGTLRNTNVPGGKEPQGNGVGTAAEENPGSPEGDSDDTDGAGRPGG